MKQGRLIEQDQIVQWASCPRRRSSSRQNTKLPLRAQVVFEMLANLFVNAARPIPPDAEGANRARSASEAFLYRRLETLAETRGRFRLNADLSVPFDGAGRMEVDLLCADARLVVEVDGALHLADPIAYRRDRRKDQLLQENGYLVLRFLAEDLGKELDSVLDGILRSLSARRTRTSAAITSMAALRRNR